MANRPQFSNAKIKIANTIMADAEMGGQKIKASIWLNYDNGWDDSSNRPFPPTEEQLKKIQSIHEQMHEFCDGKPMELSLQLQDSNNNNQSMSRAKIFLNPLDREEKILDAPAENEPATESAFDKLRNQ